MWLVVDQRNTFLFPLKLVRNEDQLASYLLFFFLVFLPKARIDRYVVCLPAASLRPPFLLHPRWSFLSLSCDFLSIRN